MSATTPPPTELGPLMEITENFCYYPPPIESGRLSGMTKNVAGGIGRVAPPPNKNPGYAVAAGNSPPYVRRSDTGQ